MPETVTVTACGYGSPVEGSPTLLQLAHHWLCEGENTLANLWNSLSQTAANLWQSLRNALDGAWQSFSGVVSNIGEYLKNAATWAGNEIAQLWQNVKAVAQNIIDQVKDIIARAQAAAQSSLWIVIGLGALIFGAIFFGPELIGGAAAGYAARRRRRNDD